MPVSVLSRRDFDARVQPLIRNLTHQAELRVGRNDAPDRVSDTLILAWQRRSALVYPIAQPPFAEWLQRILAFECATFIRHQARKRETLLPSTTLFEMCDGPSASGWDADQWLAQRTEMRRRLRAATLHPLDRQCALRWIGDPENGIPGETLQQIGASLTPPLCAATVWKIVHQVGATLAALDDPDPLTTADVARCIENLPAALSYQGQLQTWARYRKEANRAYCQQQSQKRKPS